MLDFTLRQVEKKARARGMFMCEWELDRGGGGRVVRLWGRGRMWLGAGVRERRRGRRSEGFGKRLE